MNPVVQHWELRRMDEVTWEVVGVTFTPRSGRRDFRATVHAVHPEDSAITGTDGDRYPLEPSTTGTEALFIVQADLALLERQRSGPRNMPCAGCGAPVVGTPDELCFHCEGLEASA